MATPTTVREALQALITSLEDDHQTCLWCEEWDGEGHSPDCILGTAKKLANEEPTTAPPYIYAFLEDDVGAAWDELVDERDEGDEDAPNAPTWADLDPDTRTRLLDTLSEAVSNSSIPEAMADVLFAVASQHAKGDTS